MITSFFVLSPRGDTILSKMYRTPTELSAHERSHTEAFFRKIKFWNRESKITPMSGGSGGGGGGYSVLMDGSSEEKKEEDVAAGEEGGSGMTSGGGGGVTDPPPVFLMPDGQSYFHINKNGLIFACASNKNVSPCLVIELLTRIAKVFKDYCGTLSEEAIRKNFILLYELLDEMLDYGYPQLTNTEILKAFVYNEPIVVSHVPSTSKMVNPKTASANAVHKPVIGSVTAQGKALHKGSKDKNEIFVDILEKLNVIFSNNGYVLNSTIDGCIQMKSYLAGNPELRLALNEDLVIGQDSARPVGNYNAVVLDDISFHKCVNLSEFEQGRVLSFLPPDGEFVVLNYRLTGDYRTPFRMFPSIEETGSHSVEITVTIRAEMEMTHFGANVGIEIPLPRCTQTANCTMLNSTNCGGPHAEYIGSEHKVHWTMKKFPGGSEQTLKIKLTLDDPCTSLVRREIGPMNMNFEIPMFNVSNLNVRYLRIAENIPGYTPYRWVRYVTQSNSYVCRI